MNRELTLFSVCDSSSISEVKTIPKSLVQADVNDSTFTTYNGPQRGRYCNGGDVMWTCRGPQLDVYKITEDNSNVIIGSFNFADVFSDTSIYVHNAIELNDNISTAVNNKYRHVFIVALNRNTNRSIICVVDARMSRVIKAIEGPVRISSIECISTAKSQVWPLVPELMIMNGILAIGTESGLVLLMDICLDEDSFSSTVVPHKITFITRNNNASYDVEMKRRTSLIHGQHICLPINPNAHHKGKFYYRANDGSEICTFPSHSVSVTALLYIPQINMLCVGFNFGGFQLFNLKTLAMECSCSLDADLPPIISFSFQEPENDPRNCCYLWLVRGIEFDDASCECVTTAAYLYLLGFDIKEILCDFGTLYTEFQSCSCKFEYNFTTQPYKPDYCQFTSSRLLNCYTLLPKNPSSNKLSDDESNYNDNSLCLFAWEAWSEAKDTSSSVYFTLFDLNQWYQTQMPSCLALCEETKFCPFMGIYSIMDVSDAVSPDTILDICLKYESVSKFRSNAFSHDLHYYPSSLSFGISVFGENHTVAATYLGIQKRTFSQIMASGPNILVDPKQYVKQAIMSGLIVSDASIDSLSVSSQRELLLTTMLENDEILFVIEVIKKLASGDLNHIGCDGKFMLDWIWNRVSDIKASFDKVTMPLFNHSGHILDAVNHRLIYGYSVDLKSLCILLKTLQDCGAPSTEQGNRELSLRIDVIQLISQYIKIILWLIDCNLLPEHVEGEEYGENEIAYPKTSLTSSYAQLRRDLQAISPSTIKPTEILIIDCILDSVKSVSNLWRKAGGDGLYPAPSIHALAGIYLLEDVSLEQKHQIMLYALLDMAVYLSDRQSDIAEKIKLFPASLNLSSGLTKFVQGIWGLDHKSFDFALSTLLDPVVKGVFSSQKNNETEYIAGADMYQRMIQAFLYQGENRKCLQFITACPMYPPDTLAKERLHMSVLLANYQISEAFTYQRFKRTENNCEDLLMLLFMACEQMSLFEKLFKLPLDILEDEALIYYLSNSSSPNSKYLLILYFLLNNRIVDASNYLEQFDGHISDHAQCVHVSNLVSSYASTLPKIYKKLAYHIKVSEKEKQQDEIKIQKPTLEIVKVQIEPSVVPTQTQSNIFRHFMKQIDEAWSKESKSQQSSRNASPMTPARQKLRPKGLVLSHNSPFIRQPISERRRINKTCLYSAQKKATELQLNNTQRARDDSCSDVLLKSRQEKLIDMSSSSDIDTGRNSTRAMSSSNIAKLLQTPPVRRLTPKSSSRRSGRKGPDLFTPQSILKVKQMMKTTSPSRKSVSPQGYCSATTQRLRFCEPTKEELDLSRGAISDEESSESSSNFGPIKDTIMLKLKQKVSPGKLSEDDNMDTEMSQKFPFSPPRSPIKMMEVFDEMTPKNAPPPFIFSPPLTRSRAKRKKSEEPVKPQLETSWIFEKEPLFKEDLTHDDRLAKIAESGEVKSESSSTDKTSVRKTPKKLDISSTPSHRMQLRTTKSTKKDSKKC